MDDGEFLSNYRSLLQYFKLNISPSFEVTLCGNLQTFIGWNISKSKSGNKVTTPAIYVLKPLTGNGIHGSNTVRTLLPSNRDFLSLEKMTSL